MLCGHADVGTLCRAYLGWQKLSSARVHAVHYRDLVGVPGGGSREAQRESVRGIVNFLKLDCNDAEIEKMCEGSYNPDSTTFNKGVQNRWKAVFDEGLKDLFKRYASRELIEMGYEKDDNW